MTEIEIERKKLAWKKYDEYLYWISTIDDVFTHGTIAKINDCVTAIYKLVDTMTIEDNREIERGQRDRDIATFEDIKRICDGEIARLEREKEDLQ